MKPIYDIALSPLASTSLATVSAKTAEISLRAYGLPENQAKNLLLKEVDLARDSYGLFFGGFYSPVLIEVFGEQNVMDALSFAYHYMAEYEISFDFYNSVLERLLECYKAEELVAYPDRINLLLCTLRSKFSAELPADELEDLMANSLQSLDQEEIKEISTPRMDRDFPVDTEEDSNDTE